MSSQISNALSVAQDIRDRCFPSSIACFLAGSVVRGEATAFSDLDIVVVFKRVENAQRRSFNFANWPVEAFVHDPLTLEYFFCEVDRPTGVPSLANMVVEGIEIPQETESGRTLKKRASQVLEEGPVSWGQIEIENSRYAISGMVEDIREPRNSDELRIVVANLYTAVAEHFCRSRNQWSAKGKGIPRRLASLDPEFYEQFRVIFETAYINEDVAAVIRLCAQVLEPHGGFLFEGHIRDAPADWRRPGS